MKCGVVLDTSFLITLANPARTNHPTARDYYRGAIHSGVTLFVPTIVVSEFERQQSLKDFGLHNFSILPFNFDDAVEAAKVANAIAKNPLKDLDERLCLAADFKIIAHANRVEALSILTEDAKTLDKYVTQLRADGKTNAYSILLKDGYDEKRLLEPGATQLALQYPSENK